MADSPLSPEETRELAELRRRAYGTIEGIAADAEAQARLATLERAAHPDVQPDQETSGWRDEPDPAPAGVLATAAPPAALPAVHPLAPATTLRRRRPWLGLVAVGVAAALMGGALTAFAFASRSAPSAEAASATPPATTISPRISATAPVGGVTLAPNPDLTGNNLYAASEWAASAGVDVSTLQSYQNVGTITPWTGTLGDGSARCVLLMTNEGGRKFRNVSCDASGGQPSVAIVESADHAVDAGIDLPVGAVLLFIETGDGIEFRLSTP